MLPLRSLGTHNAKLYGTSNRADFKLEGAYRESRDKVLEILNMARSEILLQTTKRFIVVSSLITDYILGIDFLVRHEVHLNFADRIVVGPIIGKLHADKLAKTASNSLCPVHTEDMSEFFSVSAVVDSADVEDDWECRCAVPKYGNNPTFGLPVCSEEFTDILGEFRDLFKSIQTIAKVEEFRVHTSDNILVRTPPRMIPQAYKSEVDIQINDMLDRNIIRISRSPYLSPPVIVGKKDGGIRFCIDYRNLNKIAQKDAYPLPLPNQVQDNLCDMRYFTKLDLNSGYWQIPVSEVDREKTAFSLGPGMGLYEFNVLPFGHTGGPSACQRIMDQVMHGLEQNTHNFIDDILLFSPDAFSHRKILRELFQILKMKNLTRRGKKCDIGKKRINYLGHTF